MGPSHPSTSTRKHPKSQPGAELRSLYDWEGCLQGAREERLVRSEMRRETNTEQMGKELHGTVRTEGLFIHLVGPLPRAFYPPACIATGMRRACRVVFSKMTGTRATVSKFPENEPLALQGLPPSPLPSTLHSCPKLRSIRLVLLS